MYGDVWAWVAAGPGKAALAAPMFGVPVAGALAQQRQKERVPGRPGAVAPSGPGLLARFVSGRDLKAGDPSSSASWWCAGTEVQRDRTAADLAADPVPVEKGEGGALRAVAAGATGRLRHRRAGCRARRCSAGQPPAPAAPRPLPPGGRPTSSPSTSCNWTARTC